MFQQIRLAAKQTADVGFGKRAAVAGVASLARQAVAAAPGDAHRCVVRFAEQFGTTDWETLEPEVLNTGATMKENDLVHPTDTVLLGEKLHDAGDFYLDLTEDAGNDFTGIAEQGRHDNSGHTGSQTMGKGRSGGSNYAMTDGSTRQPPRHEANKFSLPKSRTQTGAVFFAFPGASQHAGSAS